MRPDEPTTPTNEPSTLNQSKEKENEMNAQNEIILNQDGEQTDLAVPENFGHGLSFLNPSDMPDLEAAEVGFNIQPESIEFKEVGASIRAVFNGFTYLKTKDQANKGQYIDKQAAVLQTNTGVKINMGANLLKQLALIPVGTAVQITFRGEEKTNSGNKVKVYDVHLLNVPRANVAPATQRPAAPPPPSEPLTEDRIWTVAQKAVLIDNGKADNDFAAKGMLGLSNLPADATEAEILKWGTAYRIHRNTINPETGKRYTAQQSAEYADDETINPF
jgi:hypothetical protein